jgi:predicted Fe-Mo cluster-binding NifX family protein
MMKVALPTRNGWIEGHFGQADTYTVVTVNADNRIEKMETVVSPDGCGCRSDIAGILREMGVGLMLAGNMGEGARQVLSRNGIEVVRGCAGPVGQVVDDYLTGSLSDSGIGCQTHEHHHQHGGHHGHGHEAGSCHN